MSRAFPLQERFELFLQSQESLVEIAQHIDHTNAELDILYSNSYNEATKISKRATKLSQNEFRSDFIFIKSLRLLGEGLDTISAQRLTRIIRITQNHGWKYLDYIARRAKIDRVDLTVTLSSILTSLITGFENYLADLSLLSHKQNKYRSLKSKSYDWKVLAEVPRGQMSQWVAEDHVGAALWKPFPDYVNLLLNFLPDSKLRNMSNELEHYDYIELFLRRNLVVHTGLIVSQVYLDELRKLEIPAGVEIPKKNDQLTVDITYIKLAFQRLAYIASLLTFEVASCLKPKDAKELAEKINQLTYDYLYKGYNDIAQRIAYSEVLSAQVSEETRAITRVNGWIAKRRGGTLSAADKHAIQMEVFPDKPKYRLAKAILLENEQDAKKYLQEAHTAKEVDQLKLEVWPLFEGTPQESIMKAAEKKASL